MKERRGVQQIHRRLQQFVGVYFPLTNISPRGISPFFSDVDKAQIEAEIAKVRLTSGDKFADAIDEMLERVKRVADFLQKSVTEALDLFGVDSWRRWTPQPDRKPTGAF